MRSVRHLVVVASAAALAISLLSGAGRGSLETIPPGFWSEVSGATIRSVLPSPLPDVGYGDARAITAAWNSGAYDPTRDRLYILGGGHADYSGNEVYAFDFGTMRMLRLTDPSPRWAVPRFLPSPTGPSGDTYLDGRPASVHTYGAVEYIPELDVLWLASGSRWYDGKPSKLGWHLDLKTLQWRQAHQIKGHLGYSASYDPVGRVVIIRAVERYLAYDPRTGQVSPISGDELYAPNPPGTYDGHVTAVDPVRRKVLTIGAGMFGGRGGAIMFDLGSPATTRARPAVFGGDTEILKAYAPGLAYDTRRKRLVGWTGGGSVYVFDLDGLKITKVPAAGGSVPPSPATVAVANGIYGRWRYVPKHDLFVGYLSIDQPVYLYRPAGDAVSGSPPAPSSDPRPAPPPPASPSPPPAPARPVVDIPARTWVARPMFSDAAKPRAGMARPGMYYASWTVGGKHGRVAFNTADRRLWFFGGDWYSWDDPWEDGNGNNELWAYDVAADRWQKVYPPGPGPCAPARSLVPAQPDESTWVYDSKRNLFYAAPGFWFGVTAYRRHCSAATPVHDALVFDPAAGSWRRAPFSAPPGGWGGDLNAKGGAYDPVTDSLLRFRLTGAGQLVEQLSLTSGKWSVVPLGGGLFVEQDVTPIDVRGRRLYGVDYRGKRLVAWHIDEKTVTTWPFPGTYVWNCQVAREECFDGNNAVVTFDSTHRALFFVNIPDKRGRVVRLFAYWVDTQQWEEIPLASPPGITVNGNTMGYDPINDVHVLIGGRVSPYFFLWRLGPPAVTRLESPKGGP